MRAHIMSCRARTRTHAYEYLLELLQQGRIHQRPAAQMYKRARCSGRLDALTPLRRCNMLHHVATQSSKLQRSTTRLGPPIFSPDRATGGAQPYTASIRLPHLRRD